MKQIKAATATEFGVFNVCVSGYDMTLVEHYSQYIHNLCNHLDIRVDERWDKRIFFPTKLRKYAPKPKHILKIMYF